MATSKYPSTLLYKHGWLYKLNEGEIPPFGYGLVRYSLVDRKVIMAPLPLNFIYRWTRKLYYWVVGISRLDFDKEIINELQIAIQKEMGYVLDNVQVAWSKDLDSGLPIFRIMLFNKVIAWRFWNPITECWYDVKGKNNVKKK
jgi:hypothetical protein